MADADLVSTLVQRLRAGDPRAAEELFTCYSKRLTRLAEQHLSKKVATRIDGEDVVQSAFRTFFRRHGAGEFQIDHSNQLWRLLVTITLRKAHAVGRYHTGEMPDARQDVGSDAEGWVAEGVAREPGPEEAAMLVDEIDCLLRGLPDVHGHILSMRLQGQSVAEIAPQLGISRMSVYRALELLQGRLEKGEGGLT